MSGLLGYWHGLSLRRQLSWAMAVVCVLALLLAGTVTVLQLQRQALAALDETMGSIGQLVADRSSAALAFGDEKGAAENLAALGKLESVEEACLQDTQGRILAVYGRRGAASTCGVGTGAAPREYRFPVVVGAEPIGELWLKATDAGVMRRLRPALHLLASGLLMALGIALLAAVPLQRLISAPLERIRAVAQRVDESGDYEHRVPDLGTHEWGRLGNTFNRMLDTIQRQSDSLSERERYARALFGTSHIAQLVLAQADHRIVEANGAAATLLLGSDDPTPLIGQGLDAFFTSHELLRRLPALQAAEPLALFLDGQRGEKSWQAELHLLRVDRPELAVVHVALEDVTERRANELAVRRHTQELEQRVAERTRHLAESIERLNQARDQLVTAEKQVAMGRLVAGMAHEINTPVGNARLALSSLESSAQQFGQQAQSGLRRSELMAFLAQVEAGAALADRNLTRVAELISTFKQMAADEANSQRRSFVLHELVTNVLTLLGPQLKRASCEVRTDIPLELRLLSHPGPLDQVLMNLIQNALMHGLEGRSDGLIQVRAEAVGLDQVRLCVEDNGSGIAPEHRARIFDPFFTTKMGRGGLGLGLSISQGLVQQILGGQISVASEPGKGTCFELLLPLQAPAQARETQAPAR